MRASKPFLFISAFTACILLLLLTPYPLIAKLVMWLAPLMLSTLSCFASFYMFISSERRATREVLLVHGERSVRGVVQVYDDEVNCSLYRDRVNACCYVVKYEDESDEDVTFAGKVKVEIDRFGEFEDEVEACMVDRIAERAWNSYFGRSSRWHSGRND